MEENQNTFREDLDRLVELLYKLKNKIIKKNIEGIDESFFDNFELILEDYKKLKNEVTESLLNQYGTPIHIFVNQLIMRLKNEIDLDDPEEKEILDSIADIDKKLINKNLSAGDIDELLDKRSELNKKQ